MPHLDEAQRIVLDHTSTRGTETVALFDAMHRVLAGEIRAPWAMPLDDNSAMDGYAVRVADCSPAARLRIAGTMVAGGAECLRVEPGCAVKVMTGARLPEAADAVVPFENATLDGDVVLLPSPVRVGQHIRRAGSDVAEGELVVARGTRLRAAEISMIAACSLPQVEVYRRPRVAVLSTGDELLEIGQPIGSGQVIDANGVTLAALARECGAEVELLGIARDDRASHRAKMQLGLEADIFLTSAGVSVGERDYVREVLAELGVRQLFHALEVRPGGPTTFGCTESCLVFCLPGNPVAALLIFEELVRPAILKALGCRRVLPPALRAALAEAVRKRPGKLRLMRVRLEARAGGWLAFDAGDQNTGMLKTLVRADAIAVLPAAHGDFAAGEEVEIHPLDWNVLLRACDEEK